MEDLFTNVKPGATVLVLNVSYEPIQFSNWKRAVLLVIKEKATVVAENVIRLVQFVKIPFLRPRVPTRKLLFRRDNYTCQYCGKEHAPSSLTVDHVLPRSKGGGDEWTNVVAACSPCNLRKGNRTPKEANMPLRNKPYAPFNKVALDLQRSQNKHWRQYYYH